ncbi:MAG: zf-HC2 domain-containing protein [Pseudomonadota bacterium]
MTRDSNAGRVVRLGPPGHDETQRLLPWLLTGQLDADEQAMVQAHLAACPRCRGELEWERRLQARYAELEGESDAERGLAALRLQMQRPPPAPGLAQRLARLRRGWQAWRGIAPGLRGALVLQGAAIVALLIGLAGLMPPAHDGAYKALGQAAQGPHHQANAVVRFHPQAQDIAMRQALQGSGARVVDGPTASGAYLLHLPAVERDSALRRLRADPAVMLAESLE